MEKYKQNSLVAIIEDLNKEGIESHFKNKAGKEDKKAFLINGDCLPHKYDLLFYKNNLPLLILDIIPEDIKDLDEFYKQKLETYITCLENNVRYFIVKESDLSKIGNDYKKLKDNHTIYIHNFENIGWKVFKQSLFNYDLVSQVPISKTKFSKLTSKQVIVIRKDLMNPFNEYVGKMIAQGAHGSLGVFLQMLNLNVGLYDEPPIVNKEDNSYNLSMSIQLNSDLDKWLRGIFTKIVVYAEDEEHLLSLYEKAKDKGIPALIIEDVGLTKFNHKKTLTSLALGPYNSFELGKLTRNLELV